MDSVLLPRLANRSTLLVSSAIRDLLHLAERPEVLSLAGGLPDGSTFPVERIAEATTRALAFPGRYGATALQYGPSEGLTTFREWIAAGSLLHDGHGAIEATLVTTGSQQALDLLGRVLVDPGDVVVVEDPLYLGARQVLTAAGAHLVGVAVDHDGMDVDALEDRLRCGLRPRLVYTVPNFQNPTGAVLAVDRRERLAALALRYGFVIIEDDPYTALAFSSERHPSIARFAPDHVVTLGSASKVLAPGLRIGWLQAAPWIHRSLVLAKQSSDLHTPCLDQLVALDLLSDTPFLVDHVSRLRATYATKAAVLHEALGAEFRTTKPRGGMFLWGHAARDTQAELARAIDAGVAYVPGTAFAVDRDRSRALRLSYASLSPVELRDAAARLRAVFR
jgi:2-aminoadipate transaminase